MTWITGHPPIETRGGIWIRELMTGPVSQGNCAETVFHVVVYDPIPDGFVDWGNRVVLKRNILAWCQIPKPKEQ